MRWPSVGCRLQREGCWQREHEEQSRARNEGCYELDPPRPRPLQKKHVLLVTFALLLLFSPKTEASFDLEKALSSSCTPACFNGVCLADSNNTCICLPGWKGSQCDHCHGRVKIKENHTSFSESPLNYSSDSKCAWLIQNEAASSILLRVSDFSTECGWDFLYIFEGDGVYNRQLAALSGTLKRPYEVAIPSSSAFVHFCSDAAKNHVGFTITVDHDECAYDCHGNGLCIRGICQCNSGFLGKYCDREVCTAEKEGETGPCKGRSRCKDGRCDCTRQTHGDFCQSNIDTALWEVYGSLSSDPSSKEVYGRASHASVLIDDSIWTFGGAHFSGVDPARDEELVAFNITNRKWTVIQGTGPLRPADRYDHTLVKFKTKLYMFGGVVGSKRTTSELWSFDLRRRMWAIIHPDNYDYKVAPQAVAGHTAHVIGNKMYIFFGYNPIMGFSHKVQIYDFDASKWSYADSRDHINGRYRHSSVVVKDGNDTTVLVYGGMTHPVGFSDATNNVTDTMIRYNDTDRTWKYLNPSGKHLFMHTATILQGLMIVTGGSLNEVGQQGSPECFFGRTLVYDIACNQWMQSKNCEVPVIPELERFGHTAVAYGEKLFVVGGYNGTMLSDVLVFEPADCGSATRLESCKDVCQSVRCIFSASRCVRYDPTQSSYAFDFMAVVKNQQPMAKTAVICQDDVTRQAFAVCEELKDCLACSSQSGCGWCVTGNQCLPSDADCIDGQEMIRAYTKCASESQSRERLRPCSMARDCYSCKLLRHCNWFGIDGLNSCISLTEQAFITTEAAAREAERLASATGPVRIATLPTGLPIGQNVSHCPTPCAELTSCKDCTSSGCMWCSSASRCVSTDSYLVAFPYGQCHSWVTLGSSSNSKPACANEASTCSDIKTCKDCQIDPDCGWMDYGEETGMGKCLEGNNTGPLERPTDFDQSLWYFIGCPQCQCNGHSRCVARGTKLLSTLYCENCNNNTTGKHCERCADGFSGDSRNGGQCKPCECNGQADSCHPETGVCRCRTKGVIGDHCERCDQKYYGEPRKGEPCRYELTVDFIFTFKLKNDYPDKDVTEIQLFSVPYKRDTDVTFQISCEGASNARIWLNLTSNYFDGRPGNPRPKMSNQTCDSKGLRRLYLANDPGFAFGTDTNTTFYVKVSNFSTPITIQVSFAQTPPINWVLFFVIFAACFIVLLVVAGLLWCIKGRIEAYRRRQAIIIEHVHMASRPFSSVRLDFSTPHTNAVATPVSIEPCSNYRTGVFTVAVRLPTGGNPTTPNSTSGMAVASALCFLTQPQLSVLQATDSSCSRENRKKNITNFMNILQRHQRRRDT